MLDDSDVSEKDKVIIYKSEIIEQLIIKIKYIELVNNKLLQL